MIYYVIEIVQVWLDELEGMQSKLLRILFICGFLGCNRIHAACRKIECKSICMLNKRQHLKNISTVKENEENANNKQNNAHA